MLQWFYQLEKIQGAFPKCTYPCTKLGLITVSVSGKTSKRSGVSSQHQLSTKEPKRNKTVTPVTNYSKFTTDDGSVMYLLLHVKHACSLEVGEVSY